MPYTKPPPFTEADAGASIMQGTPSATRTPCRAPMGTEGGGTEGVIPGLGSLHRSSVSPMAASGGFEAVRLQVRTFQAWHKWGGYECIFKNNFWSILLIC